MQPLTWQLLPVFIYFIATHALYWSIFLVISPRCSTTAPYCCRVRLQLHYHLCLQYCMAEGRRKTSNDWTEQETTTKAARMTHASKHEAFQNKCRWWRAQETFLLTSSCSETAADGPEVLLKDCLGDEGEGALGSVAQDLVKLYPEPLGILIFLKPYRWPGMLVVAQKLMQRSDDLLFPCCQQSKVRWCK